jgi:hypothetical protein
MEDFSTIPKSASGSKDSLMQSRRLLKRSIADRRDEDAAAADADRMGNPHAMLVMQSGFQHGIELQRLSSSVAVRDEDHLSWEQHLKTVSRQVELQQSDKLLSDAVTLHARTTDTSNAFAGTYHKLDKEVLRFQDVNL